MDKERVVVVYQLVNIYRVSIQTSQNCYILVFLSVSAKLTTSCLGLIDMRIAVICCS